MGMYLFVYYFFSSDLMHFVYILLVAIPSSITLIFEEEITSRMVEMVHPRKLEDGDIIAFNVMSGREKAYFASRSRSFGRLVTKQLMEELRGVDRSLPVYRDAAPLAFFIVFGVFISLLFGNIVLFIL